MSRQVERDRPVAEGEIEVTEEMIEAGQREMGCLDPGQVTAEIMLAAVFRAILSVSPGASDVLHPGVLQPRSGVL